MSSFTSDVKGRLLPSGRWMLTEPFRYYVGEEGSEDVVEVPDGFVTNLTSGWFEGKHSKASVLHDWLYTIKDRPRKEADKVFLEAMGVLGVGLISRYSKYIAVRLFGWNGWRNKYVNR